MEESVATLQQRMVLEHRPGHDIRTGENVNRQALGRRKQFAIRRDDAAGKVFGAIENSRTSGPQQRVRHFADDSLDPAVEDGEFGAIQFT
jgi:hypothetical protein